MITHEFATRFRTAMFGAAAAFAVLVTFAPTAQLMTGAAVALVVASMLAVSVTDVVVPQSIRSPRLRHQTVGRADNLWTLRPPVSPARPRAPGLR